MIDCVYYNDFIRCYRNGVVERFWRGLYWRIVKNTNNNNFGYNQIRIDKMIFRHRIIAFCFLGLENIKCKKNMTNQIDHKNHNTLDNRVDNLRIVNNTQNQWNNERKGITFDKSRNKWRARINVNNKEIHLGRFENENDAREAYLNAKRTYHII